jgi:hypothetical protein
MSHHTTHCEPQIQCTTTKKQNSQTTTKYTMPTAKSIPTESHKNMVWHVSLMLITDKQYQQLPSTTCLSLWCVCPKDGHGCKYSPRKHSPLEAFVPSVVNAQNPATQHPAKKWLKSTPGYKHNQILEGTAAALLTMKKADKIETICLLSASPIL